MLIKLLRPKQWAKNLLVFAALLFSAAFVHLDKDLLALAGFAAMCMASSATYVFNDLADIERDRAHPTKRFRPLASGKVSKSSAIAIGVVLLVVSLGIGIALGKASIAILVCYLLMQVCYNAVLKRRAVADVYCIGAGFVLRAALGAAAIRATISPWLLFCTGTLALMLGFAKRRHEFRLQGDDRSASRESLVHYSQAALDNLVVLFAACASLFYGIYCIDSQTAHKFPAILLTSPFVFYGISRYLVLVFADDEGGEPADILFRDKHIIASVSLFIVATLVAVTGLKIPIIER